MVLLLQSSDSVQLALKLDGSKLDGRSIRVKRSVKKEKTKSGSRGTTGRTSRGRAKGPAHGSGKKFSGNQTRSTSFKGQMVDLKEKTKKRQKKKTKPKKTIHI